MNTPEEYTDSEGRVFYYEQGRRVYADGGKDREFPVPSTPTLKEEPEEFSWKHLQLVKAIQDAGFVVEEFGPSDGPFRLACMSAARTYGFWIAMRSVNWFIGNWAGHFYRGQGRGGLQELCMLLLRNPPGVTTALQSFAEYPLPKTIQQQFALEELECGRGGLERALGPSLNPHEMLVERFGFRSYLASEGGKGPELRQAWAARNQDLGELVVPLEPERVLMNDDLIFIPYPYYTIGGPGGFLFERRTGRGLSVWYPFTSEVLVWAYYRGFGWPTERCRGTLTIKAVHDLKLARLLLEPGYARHSPMYLALSRRLSAPPFALRDVDLDPLFALALFRAEEEGCGCIEFEITPAAVERDAALDGGPTPEAGGSGLKNSPPTVS
jgi:hypothetical protein